MIVLDTNILSELMRPQPDAGVIRWVASQPMASLCTTSIAQAEIMHGIMLLPTGKRRSALEAASKAMFQEEFAGRILTFGSEAAVSYAQVAVARRRAGKPISHFDAQIAAIAIVSGASLATRNVEDFEGCGLKLINPWKH